MKINRKLLIILIFLIAISIGFAVAYFTEKTQELSNNITVGDIKTDIIEPSWDPDNAENIEPDKSIPKDPKIKNTGSNPCYVYLALTVPKSEVRLVLDGEMLSNKQNTELFTYDVNSNWEEISTDTSNSNYNVHVYAYTSNVLSPNEETSPLFTSIKFKNVLEGELSSNKEFIVNVRSYAIQSDKLRIVGITTKDKMIYAYNNYIKEAS